MDAGCGTGMVGGFLAHRGYKYIDGTDLSSEMVEQAQKLNIYRELWGNIDLTQPPADDWQQKYDIVTCCGVFTLGHVPPETLHQLFSITKPNGIVVTSVRTSYFDSQPYERVSSEAVANHQVKLVAQQMNAPYTRDSNAHYFTYQVTPS